MPPTPDAPKLTDAESVIYDALRQGSGDVAIAALYEGVFGGPAAAGMTSRRQQQALSAFISRLNAKLARRREVVTPGIARRTYRLRQMRS